MPIKGGVEVEYDWEKDLKPYASQDKIEKLYQLVNNKTRKGQMIKWSIIVIDLLCIAPLFLFIDVLNILEKEMDSRVSLINGFIAFELAIVTFVSPIQISIIKKDEVDKIIGIQVTRDIIEKIRKTIQRKTSGIEKWFAVFGACGIFAINAYAFYS